jgi:lipoate---protein ligase
MPVKYMLYHSIYKVPNGKLLKIFLEYTEKTKKIETIKITGDFFAYPEESIEMLETQLKNAKLTHEELLTKIRLFIKEHNIEFIGLNAEELTKGILMCIP